MLETQNFYVNDDIKRFLEGETSFPYLNTINNRDISEKDLLLRLIVSDYNKKEDKVDELKSILTKLIDPQKNYKYIFSDNNLENIENSNKNIFSNKINLDNNKLFYIYKELSKLSLIDSYRFNLILETYYILKNIAEINFKGSLKGRIFVSSGFGDTGLALSQAVKYLGGISIIVDINPYLLRQREEEGLCDYFFEDFQSAFDFAFSHKKEKQSKIIGLLGNGSEIINKILDEGLLPDIITDSTNTDLGKYFPAGYDYYDAIRISKVDNHHSKNIAKHSIMMLVKAMLELQKRGSFVFEFSNNFRQVAFERGLDNSFAIKDIEDIILKTLFNKEKLNFKLVNNSNDKEDLFLINDLLYQEFPDDQELKINSDIFLSLANREINSYYLKIDKEKSFNFLQKINDMLKNEEIISPMILSNYIFENNAYLTNDNYLFNINSFTDEFKINENCLIIEGKSSFEKSLKTMLL